MNIEEIKNDYFKYCCDINLMFRDKYIENKEQILSVINQYRNDWIKEFQCSIEYKIINSKTESEICLLYSQYMISCNSYEELYHVAEILYELISNNLNLFEGLLIYFYDIVFFTKNASFKKYFKNNISLIEYYKTNNVKEYNELIKMTKVVLSKDVFKSNRYKDVNILIG